MPGVGKTDLSAKIAPPKFLLSDGSCRRGHQQQTQAGYPRDGKQTNMTQFTNLVAGMKFLHKLGPSGGHHLHGSFCSSPSLETAAIPWPFWWAGININEQGVHHFEKLLFGVSCVRTHSSSVGRSPRPGGLDGLREGIA